MSEQTIAPRVPGRGAVTDSAYRAVKILVGAYLVLSVLTVAAIAVFSEVDPALVSPEAWVRGVIVAATSVLTWVFARRACAGDARALLRLRIVTVIIPIAVLAVILFVGLPTWMVIEQAACGVILVSTAIIVLTRRPSIVSQA